MNLGAKIKRTSSARTTHYLLMPNSSTWAIVLSVVCCQTTAANRFTNQHSRTEVEHANTAGCWRILSWNDGWPNRLNDNPPLSLNIFITKRAIIYRQCSVRMKLILLGVGCLYSLENYIVAGTLNFDCVHQKARSQVEIAVCINNNNSPTFYSAAAEKAWSRWARSSRDELPSCEIGNNWNDQAAIASLLLLFSAHWRPCSDNQLTANQIETL